MHCFCEFNQDYHNKYEYNYYFMCNTQWHHPLQQELTAVPSTLRPSTILYHAYHDSVKLSLHYKKRADIIGSFSIYICQIYFTISVTTPEPTVLPPSRIAKRKPGSIAILVVSSTLIVMLSPGIHISTPSGRLTTPVTSVVLK